MKTREERQARRALRRARFKAIWEKIKAWFKNLDDKLPEITEIALRVMTGLKIAIDSKVVDIVADWIPGKLDDILVGKVRSAIDKVIDGLAHGQLCLQKPTLEEKIICFTEYIKTLPKGMQEAALQRFHAGIIAELHNNELKMAEYNHLASGDYLGQKLV